ncbi:MAG: hypothetical protein Fur003_4800 [Candidatus Dojkabacteria bacterium]
MLLNNPRVKRLLPVFLTIVALISLLFHLYLIISKREVCVLNEGIAFTLFNASNVIGLLIVNVIALGIISWVIWNDKFLSKNRKLIFLSIILGAGLINLADRLVYRAICDYIDLKIQFTPIFNIPDIVIVTTLFILIGNYASRDHTGK